MNEKKIIAVLRIFTIATRSCMLLVFAVLLPPSQFGEFSLIASLVTYSILVLGMDWYVFTTREVASVAKDSAGSYVLGHVTIVSFLYLIFLGPLISFTRGLGFESEPFLLIALIAVEHFNQESYRLLVAYGQVKVAAVAFFIRTSSWIWIAVPVLYFFPPSDKLFMILLSWGGASLISLLYAFGVLKKLLSGSSWFPIPWGRFKNAFRGVIAYWISSAAFRLTTLGDRFVLASIGGIALVGPYSLAFSVAFMGASLYEPIFLETKFSSIISDIKNGRELIARNALYAEIKRAALIGSVLGTGLFVGFFLSGLFFPDGSNYKFPLYFSVLAALYGFAAIVHSASNFCLYVMKRDRAILISNYLAVLFFVLILMLAFFMRDPRIVALAPVTSMMILLALKLRIAATLVKASE